MMDSDIRMTRLVKISKIPRYFIVALWMAVYGSLFMYNFEVNVQHDDSIQYRGSVPQAKENMTEFWEKYEVWATLPDDYGPPSPWYTYGVFTLSCCLLVAVPLAVLSHEENGK